MPGDARADRWTAPSAITTLRFNPDILRDLGVEITETRGGPSFVTVPPSLLTFRAPRGDFERFDLAAGRRDRGFTKKHSYKRFFGSGIRRHRLLGPDGPAKRQSDGASSSSQIEFSLNKHHMHLSGVCCFHSVTGAEWPGESTGCGATFKR